MSLVVLSIGGSDSGGGAGIQADIKTFSVLGLHGTSALTAVTAQNTLGVQQIFGLSAEQVKAQLESITDDFSIACAKTGMLHSADVVETVADHLQARNIPLVLDPVIEAESGGRLLRPDAVAALKDHLIPLARVVTPNIFEAEALTSISVRDRESAIHAARDIIGLGARAVIVTGGHLECTDLILEDDRSICLPSERIKGENHGVGCTFSAALTSFLAMGCSLENAALKAKEFAKDALRGGMRLGKGAGPVNQSAILREEASRYRVLYDLEKAADLLENAPELFDLLAEKRARIAMAIPSARGLEDVAQLEIGMAKIETRVCRSGGIHFGGGGDTAAMVLAAMRIDPMARAAIDLGPEVLFSCINLGLLIMDRARFDKLAVDGQGRMMSNEKMSNEKMSNEMMSNEKPSCSLLPSAIWNEDELGKGPRLYLLDSSASEVTGLTARLAGGRGKSKL